MNYTLYHLHDMRSLLDSVTPFETYADWAAEQGMTSIGLSNHGVINDWNTSAIYAHSKGLKFLFGVEAYLTETLEEKIRDNWHVIMYARNKSGADELRELLSMSFDKHHKYYKNRISFEEFCNTSDNIITTSACLASPLNNISQDNKWYDKLCRRFDFFEVQAHDVSDQKFFNDELIQLSKKYNKPLIAGTDTHSSTEYMAECRKLMMASKHIGYAAEDEFDLTLKTYDQLREMFQIQGVLTDSQIDEAISNTNVFADLIKDVELDATPKYVILHGSKEKDREVFYDTVQRGFEDKVRSNAIKPEEVEQYKKRLGEEKEVFDALGNHGYMLFMSELLEWCHTHDIPTGPSRGSVGGCCSAYCAGITDLSPVRYNTLFSRFLTPTRKDDPDIDVDVSGDQRDLVYEYIINRFGEKYTAFVLSYGTSDKRATIDNIVRGLCILWDMKNLHEVEIKELRNYSCEKLSLYETKKIKETIVDLKEQDEIKRKENPWSLDYAKEVKDAFELNEENARKKYKEVFYYFDGLCGVYTSISIHPAGIIVSPVDLDKEYGTFINSDDKHVLCLTMEAAHEARLIKYDLLALQNIQILRDTYKYVGIPYLTSKDIDFADPAIWDDIVKSGVGVFQFSSQFAFQELLQMKPRSIEDLSMLTAALRPGAASYRDDLVQRNMHKNPTKEIDQLLTDSGGRVLYQESITQFLTDICGFESNHAEDIRKAVCKKKTEAIEAAIPDIVKGYCDNMTQFSREEAESQCQEFIQVMRDAGAYAFNKSHAVGYSILTAELVNARAHWPLEFCTSLLNNAKNQDDIADGTELARVYKIAILPPEFGISNSGYAFDRDRNVIVKGVSSVKFMNKTVANNLYSLYHETPDIDNMSFIDVCKLVSDKTGIDTRQMSILIKIGYFRKYGDENKLLMTYDMFNDVLKCGELKSVSKEKLPIILEAVGIEQFADDKLKNGNAGKTWKITDINGLMHAINDRLIKTDNIPDSTLKQKIAWHQEYLGYVGISTGKPEDLRRLYITDMIPLMPKFGESKEPWSYRIECLSIGTGKSSVLYCKRGVYKHGAQFHKGDVIVIPKGGLHKEEAKNGQTYWQITLYMREMSA